MTKTAIHEVEKVEILSLQDNYIDMTAADSNAVISRARPLKDGQIRVSILAEHGFFRPREDHGKRPDPDDALRFRLFRRWGCL